MRELKFSELQSLVGSEIGTSDWWEISQARINQFAEATGDFQWIHVDEQRAKQSKFGSTIAHGYLTLSMLAGMRFQTFDVTGVAMAVNYGMNKVRFLTPVPSGSRTRAKFELANINERSDGGLECTFKATVELENAPKPACIAETISVYYPA
ncbi:MaoC family dehydratase [Orrella daihaiensis]|uniref:MaoC family dehydratase n=1 Tax=Orrella daihaiensis TaxID=2782176 RepID=A0ABY4AM14_9BURK|nr:MaoC family dehydratase [Orrella daihaiensis]UOD51083.1 MaoC family dehydratase [Orrella daihaiensis]